MSYSIQRPALTCTVCVVLQDSKVDLNNNSANMVGMTSKTVLSAIFFSLLWNFVRWLNLLWKRHYGTLAHCYG